MTALEIGDRVAVGALLAIGKRIEIETVLT
jgi:hypothetical protein